MIERITDPEKIKKLCDDLGELFSSSEENEEGHFFAKHDLETIKNTYANKYLLAWDVLVWANKTKGQYDAAIVFINDKSAKFGKNIFSEFIWFSENPKVGYKLLREALKYAKEKEFDLVSMSVIERHPKSEKVKSFYKKMGFVKDCEIYVAKL
jgi:GNAT superfamily N-acetyltransferase